MMNTQTIHLSIVAALLTLANTPKSFALDGAVEVAKKDYPFVERLDILRSENPNRVNPNPFCTITFIEPDVAITAATCVRTYRPEQLVIHGTKISPIAKKTSPYFHPITKRNGVYTDNFTALLFPKDLNHEFIQLRPSNLEKLPYIDGIAVAEGSIKAPDPINIFWLGFGEPSAISRVNVPDIIPFVKKPENEPSKDAPAKEDATQEAEKDSDFFGSIPEYIREISEEEIAQEQAIQETLFPQPDNYVELPKQLDQSASLVQDPAQPTPPQSPKLTLKRGDHLVDFSNWAVRYYFPKTLYFMSSLPGVTIPLSDYLPKTVRESFRDGGGEYKAMPPALPPKGINVSRPEPGDEGAPIVYKDGPLAGELLGMIASIDEPPPGSSTQYTSTMGEVFDQRKIKIINEVRNVRIPDKGVCCICDRSIWNRPWYWVDELVYENDSFKVWIESDDKLTQQNSCKPVYEGRESTFDEHHPLYRPGYDYGDKLQNCRPDEFKYCAE